MHRASSITALAVLVPALAVACAQPAPEPSDAPMRSAADDSAAVEAVIRDHWSAIATGDMAAVERHHVPEITVFLATWDERFAPHQPDGEAVMDQLAATTAAWTPRDFEVQVQGDVAVASFYLDVQVTEADGAVDSGTRRVSAVWVRQPDGRWLELHHHDSVTAAPVA